MVYTGSVQGMSDQINVLMASSVEQTGEDKCPFRGSSWEKSRRM
jgi:hypothetical protein